MVFSDNPERDAERYQRQQERALADCIVCSVCGEPIQDDYAYDLGFDTWVHYECIDHFYRRVN